MISCNPDVGCTTLDHGQDGSEDTTYGADLLAAYICRGGHAKKMPEQFIGPVNQVHLHAPVVRSARDFIRSTKRFGDCSRAANPKLSDKLPALTNPRIAGRTKNGALKIYLYIGLGCAASASRYSLRLLLFTTTVPVSTNVGIGGESAVCQSLD